MHRLRKKLVGQGPLIRKHNCEVACDNIDRAAQKVIRLMEKTARNSYQACPRSIHASGKRPRKEYLNDWSQAEPANHAAWAKLLGALREHKARHEEAAS